MDKGYLEKRYQLILTIRPLDEFGRTVHNDIVKAQAHTLCVWLRTSFDGE